MVRFGIDRMEEDGELLAGRVALITAPSGRTADPLLERQETDCEAFRKKAEPYRLY